MKLYIPELGDQLTLTKDWKFNLYAEHRNVTLGVISGYEQRYIPIHRNYGDPYVPYVPGSSEWWVKEGEENTHVIPVVLPIGTILTVDRIYIRKGAKDFSSISFFIKGLEKVSVQKNQYRNKSTRPVRFWAKLSDCNNIEYQPVILKDEKDI